MNSEDIDSRGIIDESDVGFENQGPLLLWWPDQSKEHAHFEMAFPHSNGNIKETVGVCILLAFIFFKSEADARRLDRE